MFEIAGGIIIAVLILANLETSLFCCAALICVGAFFMFPVHAMIGIGVFAVYVTAAIIKHEYGDKMSQAWKAVIRRFGPSQKK